MMTGEIIVTVVVTLIVADTARSSRALASRLARWAAGQVYAADSVRVKRRQGEWDDLVKGTVPSDIAALCLGVSFAAFAVTCLAGRWARTVASRAASAYGRLTADPAGPLDRDGLIVAIRQQANELRLCLAEAASFPAEAASRQPRIRRLATDLQNLAAEISRWDRGLLGGAGEDLARTALQLTDQMFPPGRVSPQTAQRLTLSVLDERIEAFGRRAYTAEETGPTEEDAAE
jgi:hypothetical protein